MVAACTSRSQPAARTTAPPGPLTTAPAADPVYTASAGPIGTAPAASPSTAPKPWIGFMPQSTYFCVRLPDGQLRATAYGVGGGNTFVLREGKELARGERDAACTNYGITVLGARGQLATTSGFNSSYESYTPDVVNPRARSIGILLGARCYVDDAGLLTCMTNFRPSADKLAAMLNALGPIDHMIDTAPCAVFRDGQVACVSENGPDKIYPMWTNAKTASIVSTGWSRYYGCAVLRTGKVSCRGSSALTLRSFATPDDMTAVEVPGLDQVDEVASWDRTACARRGGQVWCWGEAARGQAGAEALKASQPMPRCVVDDAATKAAKDAFEQAQAACRDPNRQRGRDDPECRAMWQATAPGPIFKKTATPCDHSRDKDSYSRVAKVTRVGGIDDAIAIATNGSLTCALRGTNTLTCWGAGSGAQQSITFPTRTIPAEPEPAATSIVPPRGLSVDVGEQQVIVTSASGKRTRHDLGTTLGAGAAIKTDAIDMLADPPCSLLPGGRVECVVDKRRSAPIVFPTEPDGVRISTLGGSGCVLRADGVLKCGDPVTMASDATTRWAASLGAAGPIVQHAGQCARYLDGVVRCIVGDKLVTRWRDVRSMSAAAIGTTACAVEKGGYVRCAGDNGFFQRGDEGHHADTITPVTELPSVIQVAVSGYHACALGGDGTVFCWGRATQGQTGPDAAGVAKNAPGTEPRWPDQRGPSRVHAAPVQVRGVTDAIAIGVGPMHSCAVTKAAKLVCWGGMVGKLQTTATTID